MGLLVWLKTQTSRPCCSQRSNVFRNCTFRVSFADRLVFPIWKGSIIEFCVFLTIMPLLKKYIFVQMKLHLWLRNCTKPLWKRYKLRIKFLKLKLLSDRKAYISQNNFRKKLLRNTKRRYFNNLHIKKVTDNWTFGKIIVPLSSNKFVITEKINWIKSY